MSIASYFFTASQGDAERNDGLANGPTNRRAEFYRVTDINLKALYTALTGKVCPKFEPVAMSEDYSQITFTFPEPFVKQLGVSANVGIDEAVKKWFDSGEAPYDDVGDLRNLLASLVQLAKLCLESNQRMYLWNSI